MSFTALIDSFHARNEVVTNGTITMNASFRIFITNGEEVSFFGRPTVFASILRWQSLQRHESSCITINVESNELFIINLFYYLIQFSMTKIYHEKQDSALCGQHCLNNLLQESYFTSVDLANIAEELDECEKVLNASSPSKTSFESANVDESGNFSVQVLKIALSRFHGIELVSWTGQEARENITDPTLEVAFVINYMSHWYTIRKINMNWWNLDSLKLFPEYISAFYLSAYLAQLRLEGHDVFVVKGRVSSASKAQTNVSNSYSVWYDESDLMSINGIVSEKTPAPAAAQNPFAGKGVRLGGQRQQQQQEQQLAEVDMFDEDAMLARALELSRAEHESSSTAAAAAAAADSKEEIRRKRLAALEKRGL
jgi:ataxin-3